MKATLPRRRRTTVLKSRPESDPSGRDLPDQPPLGIEANYPYVAEEFALSLRERMLLAADSPTHRSHRFAASVALHFGKLDAESHRRMTAADALAIVQQHWERDAVDDARAAVNLIAVRRR